MSESKSLPDVLAAMTLGPEDRAILIWPSTLDDMAREQIAEHAATEARISHAFGAEGVIVLRATKAEGSTVGQCGDYVASLLPGSSSLSCHLAYGHSGMHSDGTATWSNEGSEQ